MTGKLCKNFHGIGIVPLSKILAVNRSPGKNTLDPAVDKKKKIYMTKGNWLMLYLEKITIKSARF